MPRIALIGLFVIWPLAELVVLIEIGSLIGVGATIVALLAGAALGVLLMRSEGRTVWRRLRAELAAGRTPAREVADGGLVVLGGGLLILPGFLSDVVGLVLLAPPTRALVRRVVLPSLVARIVVGPGGAAAARAWGARRSGGTPPPRRDYDVDGTATETDIPRLER